MSATSPLKFSLVLLLSLALGVPVHSVPTPQAEVGNAYSGAGGHASGGGVSKASGSSTGTGVLGGLELIDIFSHNAGAGGKASSGPAIAGGVNTTTTGGDSDKQSNAYSGAGGTANGGSVSGDVPALISLFSGNAGKGGSASSGIAIAGASVPSQSGTPAEKGRKLRMARMMRVRRGLVLHEDEEMD